MKQTIRLTESELRGMIQETVKEVLKEKLTEETNSYNFPADLEIAGEKNIKEYRLMYLFGAWVTGAKIYAETDEEAIFDATERANELVAKWPNSVALWCGNRLVKRYK